MSAILTKKMWKVWFCCGLFTTYFKNLHVNPLSLASVNRINALKTMRGILLEANRLSDIN